MAKPVKKVVKTVTKPVKKVVETVAKETGITPDVPTPTTPVAPVTPISPVTEPTEKIQPKSAVSLGGEDQMKATAETTRRRRAAGMQTRSRGLTGAARTLRKTLLGQ